MATRRCRRWRGTDASQLTHSIVAWGTPCKPCSRYNRYKALDTCVGPASKSIQNARRQGFALLSVRLVLPRA
jgi:hypothetical protein